MGIPTALVMKQDGHEVTGTLAMPTKSAGRRVEVKLTGTFTDDALRLSGHVDNAKEPGTIEIQGHFGEDGALEGKIAVHGPDAVDGRRAASARVKRC
ncbi:MAG TPA: hypothetical protein VF219_22385 [Vicinamibacterales bacterium]